MNIIDEWRRREKARALRFFWISAVSIVCLIISVAAILAIIFSFVHV